MIALAELHKLIHMMNKPEKRFFKLMCATETVKIDTAVRLFDLIEKTKDNEDIYFITDQDSLADLSAGNLDLLYQLILKSQRSFYSETIDHFSMNDELSNLKILFEKAQYRQCRKMIKSLKDQALLHEKFNYLLEITDLEKELLKSEPNHPEFAVLYKELATAQSAYVQQERQTGNCYQLYARLKFRIKNSPPNQNQSHLSFFEEFLKLPELVSIDHSLPKKAQMLMMKCRALCYTALRQQNKRCDELNVLKRFVEENNFLITEMSRHYIDILYNLANVYLETKETDKAQSVLKEMNSLAETKKIPAHDLNLKLRSYAFNVQFLVYTYTARYREATTLAGQISDFIVENNRELNREDKSLLLYNLVNFYIYSSDYRRAESTLEILLRESDRKGRWDLKCYARMQQLVLCYELKQYSKLPLVLDVVKNLVHEKMFSGQSELKAIEFFEDIAKEGQENGSEKKFKNWYNHLKPLMKNKDDRWSNFFYFDFMAYAASKSGAGEIKDIIHQNYKHASL
jgi:hypothetical protein